MHVQTCSQTQQHKKTIPLTSENMVEEEYNRHATNNTKELIEKALALHWTKMFSQFSEILMRVTSNSGESSMRLHSNKKPLQSANEYGHTEPWRKYWCEIHWQLGTTIGILLRGKSTLRSEKYPHCILEDVNLRTLLVGESIDKDGKRRRPDRHMGKICRICSKGVLPTQVSWTTV